MKSHQFRSLQSSHNLKFLLMKKILVVLITLLGSTVLFAQKNKRKVDDLPAFGVVDKADLQMKECDFDKNAEAVVLLDDGIWEAVTDIELRRRIRIKIL